MSKVPTASSNSTQVSEPAGRDQGGLLLILDACLLESVSGLVVREIPSAVAVLDTWVGGVQLAHGDPPLPRFRSIQFDHDGSALQTEGFDGVLHTWDVPTTPDAAVDAVCTAVGRDLTDAEWDRYAPGSSRPVVCDNS